MRFYFSNWYWVFWLCSSTEYPSCGQVVTKAGEDIGTVQWRKSWVLSCLHVSWTSTYPRISHYTSGVCACMCMCACVRVAVIIWPVLTFIIRAFWNHLSKSQMNHLLVCWLTFTKLWITSIRLASRFLFPATLDFSTVGYSGNVHTRAGIQESSIFAGLFPCCGYWEEKVWSSRLE